MRLKRNMVFNFRKLLTLRRGRRTWLEAIISLRNLNYMVFSKQDKLLVCHLQWCSIFYARQHNFTHLGTIFIFALRRDYYFMRVSAILCRGNFRHWQASTPIGVVLKWRGRLRACSQRMPRRFNTIAPLGAEDWQWLFSLSCLHLGGSKSAKAQSCLHL